MQPPDHLRVWPWHPLVLLFGLLPFQWLGIAQLGGFDVKLPYLAGLAALALCMVMPRQFMAALRVLGAAAPMLVPYAFYLLIILFALYVSPAKSVPVRQVFFLTVGVAAAAWLVASPAPRRLARTAGAVFLIAFFAGTELIARSLGLSWFEAVSKLVGAGDLNFVVYSFFRGIFNAGSTDPDALIAASQKNILGSSMLVAFLMFRAGGRRTGVDVAGVLVTGLVAVVLVMVNSRSVLIIFFVALILVACLAELRRQRDSVAALVLRTVFLALAFAAVVVAVIMPTALSDLMSERFAFSDHSTGARLEQYTFALEQIEQAMLTGVGYVEVNGQPIHNLFLGAFVHAGIGAFLLVVLSYAIAVVGWLLFLYQIVTRPDLWRMPVRVEWVAALPLLPLSRVWVAGDAGHPGFSEWLALLLFLGFVVANRRSVHCAHPARTLHLASRTA